MTYPRSISGIKRHDKYRNGPCSNWFSADTMRFWGSTMHDCYAGPEKHITLFITGEPDITGTDRRYSVRSYNALTGQIETVSEFRYFATLEKAKAAIPKYQ